MWLKNTVNLTDKQRAAHERLESRHPLTGKARQMRLVLQELYELPEAWVARGKLRAWCRWVRRVAGRHSPLLFGGMLRCA